MSSESGDEPNKNRPAIKIGSQRKGHENVGRPEEKEIVPIPPAPKMPGESAGERVAGGEPKASESVVETPTAPVSEAAAPVQKEAPQAVPDEANPKIASKGEPQKQPDATKEAARSYPPPRVPRYTDELEAEVAAALGDVSMNSIMGDPAGNSKEPEIDGRYKATVMKVAREEVFFSLPGHYEGMASLRQFDENPETGSIVEVIVSKFNADQGIYEVRVPGASMAVQDWSDLDEGMAVEAVVTGHNTGGLECEVNKIRGFMPVSQISLYRVDDLEQFLGEKFVCIVTEANPARGNLVLSRRAMLEREKEVAKEKLMGSLAVGQEHEGIVRSLRDFGAFVDIGGVDGLIHISKLSWDRVKHPSEVLEEGQKVKVKVEKIDEDTGKIGLSYRDLISHPWEDAATQFSTGSIVKGTVSKIMDFGAFVRLAAGIEGLAHISELAHHRVVRVGNVVSEGDEVTVKILSVDAENQRMSLSIKQAQAAPEKPQKGKTEEVEELPREKATKSFDGPLKGGTNKKTGGEEFGLNW